MCGFRNLEQRLVTQAKGQSKIFRTLLDNPGSGEEQAMFIDPFAAQGLVLKKHCKYMPRLYGSELDNPGQGAEQDNRLQAQSLVPETWQSKMARSRLD